MAHDAELSRLDVAVGDGSGGVGGGGEERCHERGVARLESLVEVA
jgi:hypothetical protein